MSQVTQRVPRTRFVLHLLKINIMSIYPAVIPDQTDVDIMNGGGNYWNIVGVTDLFAANVIGIFRGSVNGVESNYFWH